MKNTKKALVSASLALLLCFAMLVGTTFAWFTDSVTSAGNIIKSGKLDVEFTWADGTKDPAATTWADASAGAIFNYDLWEPGYTEVRHVKIANVGTLALKYQLRIVANGTIETNANGHTLADVIDVYYVDPATQVTDRAALSSLAPIGTLSEVLANVNGTTSTAQGILYPAGSSDGVSAHQVTIALKMQEEAGNEYQNMSIGTDFSVQLLATQYTYEEDSFDDQYDALAEGFSISASATYSTEDDTVIKTGSTAAVGNAEVTIPAGVATVNGEALANNEDVNLIIEKTETPANFTVIDDSNGTTTYEVSLETDSGAKIESSGDAFLVKLNIGVVELQGFYHNNVAMTPAATLEEVNNNGEYFYDVNTGIITFMTTSFSPFTSEYKFAGGIGTQQHPYKIDDAAKMQAISSEYDGQYAYYKWTGASTLDASDWTSVKINGSFNGNGVTFNNLNKQLFNRAGKIGSDVFTLENFTVNANININGYGAAIIHTAANNLTLKNVTVHGRIEGNNGAASFVCFGPGNYNDSATEPMQWKFINCVSDATIVATGDVGVGFVKHPYCWASQKGGLAAAQAACLMTIEDSIFTGEIIAAGTSQYKAKYFVGNANDMLVKTSYSTEFINQYGNPEGVSYATPTAKTADGIFFVGNYPGEGIKISGYSSYGICMDKFLASTASIAVTAGTNPAKYGVFTVNKLANAVKAKVTLEIAPNNSNNYGAYLGTYMSEDIALTGAESSFTTDAIKYFDITVNGNSTQESGLSSDGHTYNVVSSAYGTTFASATVRVAQYDASGNVLGVTVFNIKQ